MPALALPVATHRNPEPATADRVAFAIDRHVATTSATLAQVFAAVADTLEEPRAPDAALALHRVRYLVETLLGVAAGGVIGRVASVVLRGLGEDVRFQLEIPLRDALQRIGPGTASRLRDALTTNVPSFVKDAATRPLVDELGVRLYPRLAHAGREHHAVLTRLATAVPADRLRAFAASITSLDGDPMLASAWSEHLDLAWRHYTAAVSNLRDAEPVLPPELAASASCRTWQTWLRRVRGEKEVPAPAPRTGEYIMAVL